MNFISSHGEHQRISLNTSMNYLNFSSFTKSIRKHSLMKKDKYDYVQIISIIFYSILQQKQFIEF